MNTSPHSNLSNKAIVFLCVTTAFAIPVRIVGVSGEQFMLGLALIAGFYLVWHRAEIRQTIRDSLFSLQGRLILSVFVVWGVIAPFSLNPMASFEISTRSGLFLLGGLILGACIQHAPERHDLMWKVFVVSAFGFAIAATVALLGVDEVLPVLRWRLGEEIIAKTGLKAYATASVCMLPVVIFACRKLGGNWRMVAYVYVPIVFFMVFATITRSAMAGLIAMFITFLMLLSLMKRKYIKTVIGVIFGFSTAVILWIRHDRYVYENVFGDMIYLPGWLIDPHRQHIWRFAYERFLENPWFGVGIDQLNHLPGANIPIPRLGMDAHVVPSHPHNWIMEILSESGIIGITPVVIVLVFVAWKLLQRIVREQDERALALLVLFVGFWTCSLFSFSIWAAWWQLELYVLFAMISAMPGRSTSEASSPDVQHHRNC